MNHKIPAMDNVRNLLRLQSELARNLELAELREQQLIGLRKEHARLAAELRTLAAPREVHVDPTHPLAEHSPLKFPAALELDWRALPAAEREELADAHLPEWRRDGLPLDSMELGAWCLSAYIGPG